TTRTKRSASAVTRPSPPKDFTPNESSIGPRTSFTGRTVSNYVAARMSTVPPALSAGGEGVPCARTMTARAVTPLRLAERGRGEVLPGSGHAGDRVGHAGDRAS